MTVNQLQLLMIYLGINLWLLIPAMTHCSKTEKKTSIKIFWFTMMILLNILGVLIYWLSHNSKYFNSSKNDFKMEQDLLFTGLVMAYELLSFPMMISLENNKLIMMCLLGSLILGFINHFLMVREASLLYLIIPFIQVACIVSANILTVSNDYRIIILVVVISILNEYPVDFSKKFAFFPLFLYMAITSSVMFLRDQATYLETLIFIIRNSITYIVVVGAFYLGRKHILLNKKLQIMTKELREKNQKIEEISLLKERSRMAREIHDTLGHTLTGAIIQLEAAKKLIYIDQEKTLATIEKTQEITRDGFLEVKRAIHALRPVLIEDGNLKDALEALFEKVENDCHVVIDGHIRGEAPIEAARKVSLYRIIQESITNSIRHGQASRINISLENKEDHVEISIHDNGLGCENILEGNGLQGIRERVYSHQGRLEIKSKDNEGFHLSIFIPK